MFNLLVLLGVLGSQFFLVPKISSGDELWVFFWLTLVAVSSLVWKANRLVDVKLFALVLITTMLSVLCNIGEIKATIFFLVFINVFVGCLAVKTIAERITLSEKDVGRVLLRLWIIVHGTLILQSLGVIWKGYELSGFYTMPWIMGCTATLSIPFIRKIKSWYGTILVLPILLSHSSSIVAVALVMWFQPKLRLRSILLVTLIALSYIWLFDRGLDVARFVVIEKSIPHVHNWLVGDGVGSFAHRALVGNNGETLRWWRWAHNELYQMTTETGVLGALSVLALIFNLFKRISVEQKYTLFGICSLAMFHPIFHMPRLIPFLVLIFAYMIRRDSVEC